MTRELENKSDAARQEVVGEGNFSPDDLVWLENVLRSSSERVASRTKGMMLAKIAGWVIVTSILINLLGVIPSNVPQEDLPDAYPTHISVPTFNNSATVSGTVVLMNR